MLTIATFSFMLLLSTLTRNAELLLNTEESVVIDDSSHEYCFRSTDLVDTHSSESPLSPVSSTSDSRIADRPRSVHHSDILDHPIKATFHADASPAFRLIDIVVARILLGTLRSPAGMEYSCRRVSLRTRSSGHFDGCCVAMDSRNLRFQETTVSGSFCEPTEFSPPIKSIAPHLLRSLAASLVVTMFGCSTRWVICGC